MRRRRYPAAIETIGNRYFRFGLSLATFRSPHPFNPVT